MYFSFFMWYNTPVLVLVIGFKAGKSCLLLFFIL
nr:MAG TPA: hypothetical protein [Caudoviricetes sp.]